MLPANASRAQAAADTFRTLVAPIVVFGLAVGLIFWDSILDPPTEMQGASGLGVVLIAISTGLGADLLDKRKGGKG